MVCLAAGDGTAIVDKDAILERGQPHWPFCGVLGQAGKRSLWPSARKQDKGGGGGGALQLSSPGDSGSKEGWMEAVENCNCFSQGPERCLLCWKPSSCPKGDVGVERSNQGQDRGPEGAQVQWAERTRSFMLAFLST